MNSNPLRLRYVVPMSKQVHFNIGLNNIYSQKNTYVNTTQMVQDLTVSAMLIYEPSPKKIRNYYIVDIHSI